MSPSEPPSKRIMLVWRDDPGLTVPTVAPTAAAPTFTPTSTRPVVPTVAELLHKLEAVSYIKTDLDSAESPVAAVPAVSEPPDVFKSVPYIKIEDNDEDPSTAIHTVSKPPNSPKIVPYNKIDGAGSPSTAVPTIAGPPISPGAVSYTFATGNGAENQASTTDSRTSIWSMCGEYFDVPNDPREMFLFFRGLFDDVYKTAAAGAFLSIRQLALLHGAPSILGPPNRRKPSTIVEQESRVQPPVEGSALRLAGPPSVRRPAGQPFIHRSAGPWPVPQFPRPFSYRQPARPSSAHQPAGPSSTQQPAGPSPTNRPAGPSPAPPRPLSYRQPDGPLSACQPDRLPPFPSNPAGQPPPHRLPGPWPAPQFPRPLFYRQPAKPSSTHRTAGLSSARQHDGPPPAPSQAAGPSPSASQPGPLAAPPSPDEGCRGAKRTRPAPPPFRRLDRYRPIAPTRDLGDFASVQDACRELGICAKVIKGKYLEGFITFDGRHSHTEVSTPGCEACEKYKRPCNLLVGGMDRHVKVIACGACTQRGVTCSFKEQIRAGTQI